MSYELEKGVNGYIQTLRGSEYNPLCKKEEQNLMKLYKEGSDMEARDRLIKSNLRYACSLDNSYRGRGLSYLELISEANDGLIESIDKFDTRYNIKLFSYSKWWIIQRMLSAIEERKKGYHSELPDETDASDADGDLVEVVNGPASEEDNDDADGKAVFLNVIMSTLDVREMDMVNMYFGRNYDKSHTLMEISEKYGITKERTRKIIETAIRKIRCEAIMNMDEFEETLQK